MSDLKAIQARSLKWLNISSHFVKNMICCAISVVEELLVPFVTKVSFLGMMIWTFHAT